MPRDRRDRAGRVLTAEERKFIRQHAKTLRKANKKEITSSEIMQYAFVVLIILGIIFFAVEVVM